MRMLVTGSAGHLGEALMRTLEGAVGLDVLDSPFTTIRGSIVDHSVVRAAMEGVSVVFHTATLHKPHVATHDPQAFVDVNITGTLNLLRTAVEAGVKAFVFTSTTSVFGDALVPPPGEPAAWITEEVAPVPKNIYGVTKFAAENLCQLYHRNHGLQCIVLRTSRFFPEEDDDPRMASAFSPDNLKANEYTYRRVDIEDAVSAHLAAAATDVGFGTYIISATTPFAREDMAALRTDARTVLARRVPGYAAVYARRGWQMNPSIDRVYVNDKARRELGWAPVHHFSNLEDFPSPLARQVGAKGYHRVC